MLFSNPKRAAISLTCVLAVLIGILALIPLSVPQGVPGTDKMHHVIAFAALVLPIAALSPRSLIWVLPLVIAYGGLIEIIQPYTGRFGEWKDFQADVIGALLGMFFGLVIHRLFASRLRWARLP